MNRTESEEERNDFKKIIKCRRIIPIWLTLSLSLTFMTRYEKTAHLQKLLNSKYRLTKSGYGEIVFNQLFISTGIGINNLSSIAVPNFSPLTPQ